MKLNHPYQHRSRISMLLVLVWLGERPLWEQCQVEKLSNCTENIESGAVWNSRLQRVTSTLIKGLHTL